LSIFPGASLAAIWHMGFAAMKELAKNADRSSEPESVDADRRKPGTIERWRGDFFGGTVAALIAVPYGMALAMAMGLRPEAGLYTSIIGGVISGMISNAPLATPGLSATVVPVLAVLVKTHGVGAAMAAGALSGLIMTLIGALRVGRYFSYLPQSVVAAFTSGLGVIIVSTQIKAVFGVEPAPAGFDMGVVDDFWAVFKACGRSDYHTLSVAVLVIGLMFILPRWKKDVPAPLVAVIVAAVIVHAFGRALGLRLPSVGALPDGFPQPSLAAMDFSAFSALLRPAFTLAGLITVNQTLTVAVTARLSEARRREPLDRGLIAQGMANMVCPFFGAPPGVAMLARAVASVRAGAVTRWSTLAHSLALLLFLFPLREFVSRIPLAALGAVTVAVGLQLIDWKRFRDLRNMSRPEAALFLITFCLIVSCDLIVGVGAGALVALLLFVRRAAAGTVQGAIATWRPREAQTQEATRSLSLPVPYRTPAARLEPIVPDPANKEPSAIDPFFNRQRNEGREDSRAPKMEDKGSYRISKSDPRSSILDPQSSSLSSILRSLYQFLLSRFSGLERLRSQWRRSTSNSLQAPEENNHDQSTTLRST
jgi:SulP family sulfate permease